MEKLVKLAVMQINTFSKVASGSGFVRPFRGPKTQAWQPLRVCASDVLHLVELAVEKTGHVLVRCLGTKHAKLLSFEWSFL